MNKEIRNILFFCICFSLSFFTISKFLQLNFLAGPMANKLVFYPLFLGFIYTGYCQCKYRNIFINWNKFRKYILVFLGINFLSLIIGLIIYPYYDLILNGPVEQIEKLPKVLEWLHKFDIDIEEQFLIIIWMIIRTIKTLFLDVIYTFFGAYILYCWYYNNWKKAFNILLKAIIGSLIVIFTYSAIELFYLIGNEFAKNILVTITPYFHDVYNKGTWWPPLLWNGQLRSIFAEPSYLGMYAAFAMPFLWYKFIMSKDKFKIVCSLIIVFFTFLLFLTKARTAVALFSGELCILLLYMIYLRNKAFMKNVALICSCVVISFVSANIFIPNMVNSKDEAEINIEGYFEDNLGSLASTEKRSNTARYSIMLANLNIGIDYPILGVGLNLNDAYIPEYLPEMSKNNHEVNMWINDQKDLGILKSGFPSLGEYTSRFAETGILGLVAFLLPPIFLLINLLKKIKKEKDLRYVAFTISFIGIMAAGIGDSINITYCYWVLLGLGYAMCFGKPGDDIKHE